MHTHTRIPTHLTLLTDAQHHVMRPTAGFAVKSGEAKRVTFTEKQKSVMVYFYERQRTEQIRADPKNVITQMRLQGISESNINWRQGSLLFYCYLYGEANPFVTASVAER